MDYSQSSLTWNQWEENKDEYIKLTVYHIQVTLQFFSEDEKLNEI